MMQIEYGSHSPGFGHQVTTLCYALKYCLDNALFPILSQRQDRAYGRWDDYFVPFVDDQQTARVVRRYPALEVVHNELNFRANRAELFGPGWTDLATEARDIFMTIFVLSEPVRRQIESRISQMSLPAGFSSAHIRRGDKNLQYKKYGRKSDRAVVRALVKDLQRHDVQDLFVMTDDFTIVQALRASSSLNVLTMCPPSFDGDAVGVRTTPGHMLDLLTEVVIATRSEFHFQTVNTRLTKIIRLLRNDRNCRHIFDPTYTQYTAL